jgi:hypothetical protein
MRSELVAGIAGLILVAGCAGRATAPSPAPSASAAPTATASQVPVHVVGQGNALTPAVMTWSKANRKIYTIRALSFVGNAVGGTNGSAVLDRPHITFIDRSGSATVADAPKATVKQRDNSIDMMGGVRARTA